MNVIQVENWWDSDGYARSVPKGKPITAVLLSPGEIVTSTDCLNERHELRYDVDNLRALLKIADTQIKLKDDLINAMKKRLLRCGEVRAKWVPSRFSATEMELVVVEE